MHWFFVVENALTALDVPADVTSWLRTGFSSFLVSMTTSAVVCFRYKIPSWEYIRGLSFIIVRTIFCCSKRHVEVLRRFSVKKKGGGGYTRQAARSSFGGYWYSHWYRLNKLVWRYNTSTTWWVLQLVPMHFKALSSLRVLSISFVRGLVNRYTMLFHSFRRNVLWFQRSRATQSYKSHS